MQVALWWFIWQNCVDCVCFLVWSLIGTPTACSNCLHVSTVYLLWMCRSHFMVSEGCGYSAKCVRGQWPVRNVFSKNVAVLESSVLRWNFGSYAWEKLCQLYSIFDTIKETLAANASLCYSCIAFFKPSSQMLCHLHNTPLWNISPQLRL